MITSDTICAQATAQGGAISVIRVSGQNAIEITSRIFSKDITKAKGYTLHYGHITDPQQEGANIIDDVLVSVFRSPHSYTGEDSTEISCHWAITYIIMKYLLSFIGFCMNYWQPSHSIAADN